MNGQKLCIRTFAEAIRPKMSATSTIKDYETDTKTTKKGSLVSVFYPLLLNAVIWKMKTDGETGLPDISSKMASELKKGMIEVHPKIKEIAGRPETRQSVVSYFEVNLIPNILPDALSIVIDLVDAIVQADKSLGKSKPKTLKEASKRNSAADYLGRVFLLAVTVGVNKDTPETAAKQVGVEKPLEIIKPPDEPDDTEIPYVAKCMEAYGDAEKVPNFTKTMLNNFSRHLRHFRRQRKDFYVAESVRRNTRDVFGESESDHFDALKKDIYSGVVDVYEDDYDDGLKRMSAVLQKATGTEVGATWLNERYEGVISDTKKGVCHVLANDDIIKSWVDVDE